MLNLIFTSLISIASAGHDYQNDFNFETGDVIAHTSQSSQSKMIQVGTGSKYSHIGIVFVNKSGVYVLEASGKTKYSSLDNFINRGENKDFTVLRYADWGEANAHWQEGLTKSQKSELRKEAKKYVGKSYDLAFKWSDDKMYCSELVWKVYEDIGIEVSETKKIRNFHIWIPPIKKEMERRWGGKVNMKEEVVAPVDIVKSPVLHPVFSTY